jgi:hypothetical protein
VDQIIYREPRPYQTNLSDGRVVMSIIHVFMVKLLCHVVMGWIPILEYLLPEVRGCVWAHVVMSCLVWY